MLTILAALQQTLQKLPGLCVVRLAGREYHDLGPLVVTDVPDQLTDPVPIYGCLCGQELLEGPMDEIDAA